MFPWRIMGGGRQVIAWMLEPLRCPPAVMQLGHRRPDVDQGVFIQTSVRSSPAIHALATGGARSRTREGGEKWRHPRRSGQVIAHTGGRPHVPQGRPSLLTRRSLYSRSFQMFPAHQER